MRASEARLGVAKAELTADGSPGPRCLDPFSTPARQSSQARPPRPSPDDPRYGEHSADAPAYSGEHPVDAAVAISDPLVVALGSRFHLPASTVAAALSDKGRAPAGSAQADPDPSGGLPFSENLTFPPVPESNDCPKQNDPDLTLRSRRPAPVVPFEIGNNLDLAGEQPSLEGSLSFSGDTPTREQRYLAEFQEWKQKSSRKAMVVEKCGLWLAIPVSSGSRWFPEGAQKQRARLDKALSKQYEVGVLLTLTINPRDYKDVEDCIIWLWSRYSNFRDTLNMRLKRAGRAPMRGMVFLEFTKADWPHFHIWMPGRKYLAPQREIQTLWGSIIDVRVVGGRGASYAQKYVGKQNALPEHLQALLWRHRIRMYSISPSLRICKTTPPPRGFILYGCVECDTIAASSKALSFADLQRARDGPILIRPRDGLDANRWEIECALYEATQPEKSFEDKVELQRQKTRERQVTPESAETFGFCRATSQEDSTTNEQLTLFSAPPRSRDLSLAKQIEKGYLPPLS